MILMETNKDEIKKIIDQMENKSSCGIDGINTKLIKSVSAIISRPLSYIVNRSFETGEIPDELKISLVTPVHKS